MFAGFEFSIGLGALEPKLFGEMFLCKPAQFADFPNVEANIRHKG